ncbi:MAG: hypothetical protein A2010_04505 [Nitrospirae bacterium GWD2_57_9]|nr:MAG: hypothetical protein A2010_04505 [Nitrospirae bacterium GWD2_57_9]OGW49896.1 MAG: hypothetical protein A2078_00800 [Nitrospirae bacterium GWC2_57_9]
MKKESLKQDAFGRNYRRRTDTDRNSVGALSDAAEFRLAIEATALGIFDYYPLTGELHWSHRAKEHFGLSPDAHVNYNVFLVGLHPNDRDRVDHFVQSALQRENGGKFAMEYRTIGIEDGKERWIAAHGQAFFNEAGEAVRLIGTTQDVTEHKRADEELRNTVRELEQANRELQQFRERSSSQEPVRPAEKQ